MRSKIIFLFLVVILAACKNYNNNTAQVIQEVNRCEKNDYTVQDTVFDKSDVLASIFYDGQCRVKKLELITQLDNRSIEVKDKRQIENINVIVGLINDTLYRKSFVLDENGFSFDVVKKLIYIDIPFETSFLDSINIIDIQPFIKDLKTGRIVPSSSYFFNETSELLEIENTYLNYSDFKKHNAISKVLSRKESFIDTLLVTTMVNQLIDDVTSIKIKMNDSITLDFKSSIKADFNDTKLKSNNCGLLNFKKMNSKFVQITLDIEKAKVKEIENIVVYLNGKEYR